MNAMKPELIDLQIPDILIWKKDINSVYMEANSPTIKVFSLKKPEQVVGIRDDMIPCKMAEMAEIFRYDDLKVIKSMKDRRLLEIIQCTKSNDWKIFQTTKKPIIDNAGRVTGTYAISVDITRSLNHILAKNLINQS